MSPRRGLDGGNHENGSFNPFNGSDSVDLEVQPPRDIEIRDDDTGLFFRIKLGPKALLILGGFLANFIIGLVNLITRLVWG